MFSFQQKFNKQLQGAATGSQVSSVIANIYMEEFEESALEPLCSIPTPQWKRYVDDIICIVNKDQVDILFSNLNQWMPTSSLQCSLQTAKEESIFWTPGAPLALITLSTLQFIENQLTQTDI